MAPPRRRREVVVVFPKEEEEQDEEETDWVAGELNMKREVVVRCCGRALKLAQDSKSAQCGSMVWEVAVIVAKLVDQGVFGDVDGKWCLELGSGCGLAGMAFALKGCHVVYTDLPELVPHLSLNVERNLGRSNIVAFDWTEALPKRLQETHFDIILATDCVYHSHLVAPFLAALRAVSSPTATLLLVYERRDHLVIADFEDQLKKSFKVKRAITNAKLKSIVGDKILDRDGDQDWLTILECRRRKKDYSDYKTIKPT